MGFNQLSLFLKFVQLIFTIITKVLTNLFKIDLFPQKLRFKVASLVIHAILYPLSDHLSIYFR